jgi:Bifunctional DNA primase/polymerase, N-terminal
MSGRDAAVAAALEGLAVFPCLPRDKRPAVDRWEERACTDPERVARYWPSDRHNVGSACGPSGRVVIDLDTHGTLPEDWRLPGIKDGRDVLAQLCEWAGQPWPETRMKRTPLDGWHLEFLTPGGRVIRNSAGKIGPLIDVRGAGGYVLAAGSVLDERAYRDDPDAARKVRGGKAYELVTDIPPAPLPEWLVNLACPPQPVPAPRAPRPQRGTVGARLQGIVNTVRESQPGDRTGPLVWAAFRVKEMAAVGEADLAEAGEQLVQAAMEAGIRGGETYARQQVRNILGGGL